MALKGKQIAFVEEYLKCWNATLAARRAGYSEKSIRSIASENLTKPDIKDAIEARKAELIMSADEAMIRLSDMGKASHGDFADVQLRDDLKDHPKAHLVKTVITDVYEDKAGKVHHKLRLELYDAQRAIEDILKIHGKFNNGPGSSENEPFILKVVYGSERTNDKPEASPPEAD